MEVFERRLKSIDESLTMMAMAATTKDIVAMIEQAHSKMKEMKRHGAETGNGAKAAQEEGDEFNTTAKTGAHE
jgi:mevalonate pyrophosphate decarboxylase